MLKINLVPERTKNEINLKNTYGIIKGVNYTLIFLAIVISAIFISTKTFLIENTGSDEEKIAQVPIDSNNYSKKPREINSKLKAILDIQEKYYSQFDIIKNITSKIPAGITLSRLLIDIEGKKIELKGRADLRDTLLSLKDNLEQDLLYKKVNFPIQNLLSKENIDFGISIDLDLKELSKKIEEGSKK